MAFSGLSPLCEDWQAFLLRREREGPLVALKSLSPKIQALLQQDHELESSDENKRKGLGSVRLPGSKNVSLPLKLVSGFDPAPRKSLEWPPTVLRARDVLPDAAEVIRISRLDIERQDPFKAGSSAYQLAKTLAQSNDIGEVSRHCSVEDWREGLTQVFGKNFCEAVTVDQWNTWLSKAHGTALPDLILEDVICLLLSQQHWGNQETHVEQDQHFNKCSSLAISSMEKSSWLILEPSGMAKKLQQLNLPSLMTGGSGSRLERALAQTYHKQRNKLLTLAALN